MKTVSKQDFWMSWVYYVVVCSFLGVLNYFTCSYPWVLWVMMGWGVSQVILCINYCFTLIQNRK